MSPREALPVRIRVAVPLLLLVVALFTAATLIYNAPASPARNRLDFVPKLLQPYFWQDWQLFGPNPPVTNNLIYLEVRLRDATGQVTESAPAEIEQAIDRQPRSFRTNPTKTPGIMLAFNASANNFARAASAIAKMPADQQADARKKLFDEYANFFVEMQRFFSASADGLYPGRDIVAVRARFRTRSIVPFSQRYQDPPPAQPEKELLDTSWLTYIPGIAR
ncbi:hypothetical protein ACWT_5882 [Actinoplanes sp. SE50]|uniref:DUF5819 family protein n=1 Tax=unclassified Actinoplanes TaxID=2626549 RepID=UPI00023EBDE6|nr:MULTISPECIES: DUF5819 family protein [unclassified Actinoplanes]AEV86900.1 hypothetical protein ACPL_6013 [Actinoplanes sp. SE50/110]ATO85297.1 hypothetical protein ACWT_5882 [Actinoplanes sp. SE50]SLM02707.1 uncharacterized protein ACSP50_5989 [Actinoplanes sp. SE50/110]